MAGRRQQEIKSVISVYGKADGSLDRLAGKIKTFGEDVSKAGSLMTLATAPILAAVKTSTSLYTDYDDVLRKIQAAGNYNEAQMKTVGEAARQAGADTRYMASDAAGAFLSLTQAGVALENSLETLPTLLNAAAAGDMSLTDASDLLISNIYSLGKAFDENDVTAYMDKVVTAADASNTTVQEMMEGVSKIGAAGRLFAGGDSELLAFLGMLANLNRKGTEGGIDARNMIISLLAPTKKAAELMDELDVTADELDETLSDIDLSGSAEAMKRLGLETVDADGKVRPMVDILTDLKHATDGMSDDEKANVLYSMFGKRTYASVEGLLELMDNYPELLEQIANAVGATQRKAATLEGGIGGSTRTLKSAMEELQLSIGEATSEKTAEWMGTARDFMLGAAQWIKELDTDKVNTFMDAVAGVALSGAGLAVAGQGISLISSVLKVACTPGGAIALGAGTIAALALALASAQDAAARKDLENHFGTLALDSEKVSAWVGTLASDYDTAAASINGYGDAVKTAGENYESYVQQFSGGILEAYLTGTRLNKADKEALQSYAAAMVSEVKTAVQQQKLQLGEIIQITYDGTNAGDGEKADAWNEALNGLFGALNADAQAAGQNLMQVYLDAAKDGVIDADESRLIAEAQAKLNGVMAQIEAIQSDVDWNTALARAMNLDADSWQESMAMIAQASAESDRQTEDNFAKLVGMALTYEQRGMAIPQSVLDAYGIGQGDFEGWKNGIWADEKAQKLDNGLRRNVALARFADAGFDTYLQNDDGVDLSGMTAIAQGIIDGTLTLDEAFDQAMETVGEMDRDKAQNTAQGLEGVMAIISDSLPLDELLRQIQRQKETQGVVDDALMELYRDYLTVGLFSGEALKHSDFDLTTEGGNWDGSAVYLGGKAIGQEGDLAVGRAPQKEETTKQAEAYVGFFSSVLQESDVQLPVGLPDAGESAQGFRDGVQRMFDAAPAVMRVVLSASGGEEEPEKPVFKKYASSGYATEIYKKYALGGYADRPAIFGEDGGEWAIPQQKTERSRILLRQAAAGSGFAPEEIYPERKTEKTAMNFTFAPTIYARDAGGVKDALESERAEMMRLIGDWWNEKMRENERVSFA